MVEMRLALALGLFCFVCNSNAGIVAERPTSQDQPQIPPGGVAPADINDPYILELAGFSVEHLDKASNELFHKVMVRLVEAKKQTVAGTLVTLKYELGLSECKKGETQDKSQCKVPKGRDTEICDVIVYDKPWLKERTVTKSECAKAKKTTKN